MKYIGVIINHKLNWCEHIAYVENKVSKGIGILYKARQFVDKKSLHNMYYYYIYPYIIYCIRVWGSACQTHLIIILKKYYIKILIITPLIFSTKQFGDNNNIFTLSGTHPTNFY